MDHKNNINKKNVTSYKMWTWLAGQRSWSTFAKEFKYPKIEPQCPILKLYIYFYIQSRYMKVTHAFTK